MERLRNLITRAFLWGTCLLALGLAAGCASEAVPVSDAACDTQPSITATSFAPASGSAWVQVTMSGTCLPEGASLLAVSLIDAETNEPVCDDTGELVRAFELFRATEDGDACVHALLDASDSPSGRVTVLVEVYRSGALVASCDGGTVSLNDGPCAP